MIFHNAHIDNSIIDFFIKRKNTLNDINSANHYLYNQTGIKNFFNTKNEFEDFLQTIEHYEYMAEEYNQLEYGDFQTNRELTDQLCNDLSKDSISPEFVLEPTCGKGNFIISSLKHFSQLKKIVGIEFYESYVWEAKFNILNASLQNELLCKPDIEIIHISVFEYPFHKLSNETKNLKTLVIGNPPWVTNSKLSTFNSNNLPNKTNFKKQKGLDAITGKSNFDIGEYIALLVLRYFSNHGGVFAFLIKNSIIRNLVYDQKSNMFNIANIERLNINAKKEFNVSVSASFFKCAFNRRVSYICKDKDFYKKQTKSTFGWQNDKFVYSIEDYGETNDLDNESPFIWRQGIKHDNTKVMELTPLENGLINGLNEQVELEENLVYGLLKSSDLKGGIISNYRKLTIITQKFLKSIIFPDFKRGITKEILMRIDLSHVYKQVSFEYIIGKFPEITNQEWVSYGKALSKIDREHQYSLF